VIVTQYDSVAEIEAMKARRRQNRRSHEVPAGSAPRQHSRSWSSAREEDIRAEMDRRIARRAAARAESSPQRG
jgi:hypothetical protein